MAALVRTKDDETFLAQGGYWDESKGQEVISFIHKFCVTDNGKPLRLFNWQKDFIRSLYCWRWANGERRITHSILSCARRNGKTLVETGIEMYELFGTGKLSPRVISAATTRDQAALIFDSIHWNLRNNEETFIASKVAKVLESKKRIEYPAKHGFFQSVSSDAKSKLGFGYTCVVVDELSFHQNDKLINALWDSVADTKGLLMVISTCGWRMDNRFYSLFTLAQNILKGTASQLTLMPWIFSAPPESDFDKIETAYLGNPSLGETISEKEFIDQWQLAKQDSVGRFNHLRLRFNSWTQAENVFIPIERWDSCRGDTTITKGSPLYLAADIGGSHDLSSIVGISPQNGKLLVKEWNLVPSEAVSKRDKPNALKYAECVQDGSLTMVQGEVIKSSYIVALLQTILKDYSVKSFTADKWSCKDVFEAMELENIPVFQFPQVHSYYHSAVQSLEKAVMTNRLIHSGGSCLRWQIGHTFLDIKNEKAKPATDSEHKKKDTICALLMAMSQATLSEFTAPKPSVYETRGIIYV